MNQLGFLHMDHLFVLGCILLQIEYQDYPLYRMEVEMGLEYLEGEELIDQHCIQ